jgi:hypothetical protein
VNHPDAPALTPQIVDSLMSSAEVSPINDGWIARLPWSSAAAGYSLHSAAKALSLLRSIIPAKWDHSIYPSLAKKFHGKTTTQ